MAAPAATLAPTPIDAERDGGRPVTLTVEQAAVLLAISRSSAYRAVNRGDIPAIRIGRRILVPTAKLCELLGLHQLPDWFTGQHT